MDTLYQDDKKKLQDSGSFCFSSSYLKFLITLLKVVIVQDEIKYLRRLPLLNLSLSITQSLQDLFLFLCPSGFKAIV